MFIPPPPEREDQPAEPGPSAPTLPADPPGGADLRAFVGPNADYYLRAWAPALSDEGEARGFNVAAAFLTPAWLFYRRMPGPAVLVYAALAAMTRIDDYLTAGGRSGWPVAGLMAGVGVFLLGGLCGNAWYLANARRAVAQYAGLDEAARREALGRAGGVNLYGALVTGPLICLAIELLLWILVPSGPARR